MSIQHYPLYDFITQARRVSETTPLTHVLSMFEQEQHSQQLVVVSEQQIPRYLLDANNLLGLLIYRKQDESGITQKFDWNQPISCLDKQFVKPIQILSSSLSLEQFGSKLRSEKLPANFQKWVLVDEYGKFLGLLDSSKLLRCLALLDRKSENLSVNLSYHQAEIYQEAGSAISVIPRTSVKNINLDSAEVISYANAKNKINQRKSRDKSQLEYKYATQLLQALPWALMLETDTQEVVSQNQLWYEQLGELKDPQGIKELWEKTIEGNTVSQTDFVNPEFSKKDVGSTLNRCFIDSEPGSCICIVEMRDGEERVWRFTKIPVNITDDEFRDLRNQQSWSQELKVLQTKENSSETGQLWLVLATDITEQQQLTQELAAKNADLIQLNRLKDEFLACISHELKTPLTAVLGLSRLLSDQQLGKLNDRQARYAQLIHQSGRHLMSVVNDILDLTRMETGQMSLTPTKVNIKKVCDRASKEAKDIHAQTTKATASELDEDYQFRLDIEPGLEEIIADELRLRQMLIHLLSNAYKFTEAGGEIGLQVNSWEGWITFTVWDTGIGIADSQQHLIFQKFQQLENPMTRQHEGTGLGLVLTRALARLHGGDVSFLSREGYGSQFTLLLPPSPPHTIAGEIGSNDSENCSDITQKVIEDTPLRDSPSLKELSIENIPAYKNNFKYSKNQDSIAKLKTFPNSLVMVVETVARYIEDFTKHLSTLGYRVVVARSGCEALEKARRLQPKAIFINPLLPLLSGWDVLTLIKSDTSTRDIPVIVTASAAEKEQAFSNRADRFLTLPVKHQAVAEILESLYDKTAEEKPEDVKNCGKSEPKTPLRILRLVEPEVEPLSYDSSLGKHRVIEADDLAQAQLLARVWKFDVALLDVEMPLAQTYLNKISDSKILAALPLVTRNVETTQAASQIAQLSVFPCLTKLGKDNKIDKDKAPTLLSVLQIAAGVCCPPSISVLDLTIIPDLPGAIIDSETKETQKNNRKAVHLPCSTKLSCPLKEEEVETNSRPTEWFQALVQYLQTAGLKSSMCNTWEELLQQIRHGSVDLLLICLGESTIEVTAEFVVEALEQMGLDLPPLLFLDQRLNSDRVELEKFDTSENIAAQVLPRSISMEDLLSRINQALTANREQ
ncbi:signal transduction histidine kinase [Rivularia sp. PCC 7116]|uniref:ATP-binding protein n=1 Tax=Rivularia sp. PCC 7116 TaxID=373994 RepID=UPI00029ECDB5|nr:ATP-binding protein [Rivularia sp. PCC 7116]AFY55637.1 signal transduction histidine kinase [Rivularia sp. PCC 7116]